VSAPAPRNGHVIAVLNLKGGVGKTHCVWLIAGVSQERGQNLLVVDLDTQGNLTRSLLPDANPETGGVQTLFDPAADADPLTLIQHTRFSHVDVIPAGPSLARFDVTDQRSWEQSDLHFALADALRDVRDGYDLIVFDCPPRLSLVSFAALCAADYVIIPLEAADWGAQGIVQVTQAVNYVRGRYNANLQLLGYLVSRFKRARAFQQTYLAKLRQHFGPLAMDTVIPDVARFEQSVTVGVPITLHSPGSIEAGIARRLFAEIHRRIGRSRRTGSRRRGKGLSVAGVAVTA
jgi:chromosome partitioning protein